MEGGIVLAPAGVLVGFVRVASRGGKRAACDRVGWRDWWEMRRTGDNGLACERALTGLVGTEGGKGV